VSEENVELARRWLERLNAVGRTDPGDFDPEQAFGELWQRIDADVVLQGRPDVPDATDYRGREGFAEFLRMIAEVFAEIRWEPQEFIDRGDAVIVVAKVVAVGRGSDVPVEMDETDVVWFRDGSVIRVAGFPTREEGLAAAGGG
jgi:ketosteroid isomerase-like protein